jgi:sulfide:quinone oxidoreductase
VYAVGDVTMIPLANGLPLPKAGFMAEREGVRVAQAIAADVRGEAPPAEFDGTGLCPIELGFRSGAIVEGQWYEEPEPIITVTGPGTEFADGKARFEAERLERWFA